MVHIRELDSIRGIGILMVVAFHWLPVDSWYNTFPNRPFGVDVFFVLSGFLITQILLRSKLTAEACGIPLRFMFMNFYFKRALRILPVYFLVVCLILMFHSMLGASVQGEVLPALTFTLNFHFFHSKNWGDLTTHLWTLSIEEQFYLVWPCIVLLCPSRHLPLIVGVFIGVGVGSQLLINDREFGYLPTYTCFDAFGIGALMAWICVHQPGALRRFYQVIRVLGIFSSVALLIAALCPDLFFLSPQRTLRSMVAAWAISFILYRHYCGQLEDVPVFSNRCLIFLGKISYGMYMYHIFFPWLYPYINAPIISLLPGLSFHSIFVITLLQNSALLIVVSWISYNYLERPIMRFGTPPVKISSTRAPLEPTAQGLT